MRLSNSMSTREKKPKITSKGPQVRPFVQDELAVASKHWVGHAVVRMIDGLRNLEQNDTKDVGSLCWETNPRDSGYCSSSSEPRQHPSFLAPRGDQHPKHPLQDPSVAVAATAPRKRKASAAPPKDVGKDRGEE